MFIYCTFSISYNPAPPFQIVEHGSFPNRWNVAISETWEPNLVRLLNRHAYVYGSKLRGKNAPLGTSCVPDTDSDTGEYDFVPGLFLLVCAVGCTEYRPGNCRHQRRRCIAPSALQVTRELVGRALRAELLGQASVSSPRQPVRDGHLFRGYLDVCLSSNM